MCSVSAPPTPKQKSVHLCTAISSFLPKKTSGLRSARPKKKPPIRATIFAPVSIWWLCIPKLEPILARSAEAQPRRTSSGQARAAPRQKKPSLALFLRFPPAVFFFLVERVGFFCRFAHRKRWRRRGFAQATTGRRATRRF